MDIQKADNEWNIVILRWFNPVSAHTSRRIGENPNGIQNNLIPYITKVVVGKRSYLGVFGNDYPTHDGTGERLYPCCDLANGHVAALKAIENQCGVGIYDIGNGHGYSVLEMVNAFVNVNGVEVPYSISPVEQETLLLVIVILLRQRMIYGIEEMVRDSWRWQRENPEGAYNSMIYCIHKNNHQNSTRYFTYYINLI